MTKKIFALLFIGLTGTIGLQVAHAEVTPQPLPTDARMVVMQFNPSQIYKVLTAPTYVTHIRLEEGEKLAFDPALGDTVQWEVESAENNIFIKPDLANIRTNMSIVTNKRTYQFDLVSSPEGGMYYQFMEFKYRGEKKKLTSLQETAAEQKASESDVNLKVADPSTLNTNYKISGSSKFKPDFVEDDGKFTYIKFPDDLTELPMIYVKENGAYSQVNFTPKPKNNFVTVTRVADEFVLMLDKEEVKISKKKNSFW